LETCKAEIKRQTDGGLWHFVGAFFLPTSCPTQYQDVRNSLSQQANATYTFNQTHTYPDLGVFGSFSDLRCNLKAKPICESDCS
jgi:hypothetical protein